MTGAHRPQRPFRRHNRRDAARAARRNRARYRAHDAYIAGAAAQIAAHRHPYLPLAEGFGAQHEIARADQHPRSAVAALQGVLARKRRTQLPYDVVVGETFDRRDARTLARNCIDDARTRGLAVDQDRASAAHAVLAAEVRPSQVLLLAQKIGEVGPRLDRSSHASAIDGERKRLHDANAWRKARRSAAMWICCLTASCTPCASSAARATC